MLFVMITITDEERFKIVNLIGRIKTVKQTFELEEFRLDHDLGLVKFLMTGENCQKEIDEVEKILGVYGWTVG